MSKILKSTKLLMLGNMIIDGPRAIFPPKKIDNFGWLSPQFKLVYRSSSPEVSESIIVYFDDTCNRSLHNDPFLSPILRYCSWKNILNDKLNRIICPTVNISFSFISQENWNNMNKHLNDLQNALTTIPYIPSNIIKDQEFLSLVDTSDECAFFNVSIYNGEQKLDFYSRFISNNPITHAFKGTFDILKSYTISNSFDRKEWIERYDHGPGSRNFFRCWDWDGTIDSLKKDIALRHNFI